MLVETHFITAEELAQIPCEEGRLELVRGELLKMPPAGHEHGEIASSALFVLTRFVRQHQLGKTYAAETGFTLSRNPDTVRAPDAAFVTAERAAQQKRRHGFFDGVPDLAVEVVSPGDSAEEVEEKILDYLEAGVRLLWIINPRTRTVAVYRSLTDIRVLTLEDNLEGYDVLPGFTVPVRELFGL